MVITNTSITNGKLRLLLFCGIAGSLLMAGSDWLMIYGSTEFTGQLAWLTSGVAGISAGRNAAAMFLAFPAVLLYSAALFAIRQFLNSGYSRRIYSGLTVIGLTPWLCLHLFYCMILFLFSYMSRNHAYLAHSVCEALFGQFSWIVILAEVLMLLPFLYYLVITAVGGSVFPRWMALNNPLILYLLLKGITMVLPNRPWRLAFINGLMSEAMLIWFVLFLIFMPKYRKN